MTGTPTLTADDFVEIFTEIHGPPPFPWQARLAHQLANGGDWPAVLDLPTGSGKTAALDVALFHLALQADKGADRTAPVRIAFVVDRRIIVDAAFERAKKIADALEAATDGALARMAAALRSLSGGGPPLVVQALRGGLPREGDWARTPAQPTVLCSTVDQVGSRLLFRGYGVSDSMKPIHAGLLGADCLLLLDEAHLAAPFAQTLAWVDRYRRPPWTQTAPAPWRVVTLTATPRDAEADGGTPCGLTDEDRADKTLSRRLTAGKRIVLRKPSTKKQGEQGDAGVATEFSKAAMTLLNPSSTGGTAQAKPPRTLAVVVNRVALAREVFEALVAARDNEIKRAEAGSGTEQDRLTAAEIILLTGRVRELDRDKLLEAHKARLLSGAKDDPDAPPLIVVATQTIEAGADFDFDAMVSQIAPLDALRQRFGRLNRMGHHVEACGAILNIIDKRDEAIYGTKAKQTWDHLEKVLSENGGRGQDRVVRFGLADLEARLAETDTDPAGLSSEAPDAPTLRPADVTLLSWTAPVPAVDPAVSLFLHGPKSGPADVQIVWRADIAEDRLKEKEVEEYAKHLTDLLALVPPHGRETLAVPVWAARRWLRQEPGAADTADIEGTPDPDEDRGRHRDRPAFRWAGADSDRTGRVWPSDIRPGDVIVVPASYGGCDAFGWAPESTAPVKDLGDQQPPHRPAVSRLHPSLMSEDAWARIAAFVGDDEDQDDAERLTGLAEHGHALDGPCDLIRPEGYGGAILRARRRRETAAPAAGTEDDATGSLTGQGLTLAAHAAQVEGMARAFAQAAGLSSDLTEAVALAARLHDEGKADPRFQVWLRGGDRLAALKAEEAEQPLAKSPRSMTRAQSDRARRVAGLPDLWRHESDSVRRAMGDARLAALAHEDEKKDLRGLVLWLIGTHHGHGRPLFPHADPRADATYPDGAAGPHCLDFQHDGRDWPQLFAHLTARFGAWDLARLEAIVRLADHRASEAAERTEKEPSP
jgi:CRISPR-associated endonuclease/helicase Cas3